MRVRGLLLSCCVAALLAGVAPGARAETYTVGSSLAAPATVAFGCEARPYPDITSPSGLQLLATGTTSCMWWSTTYGSPGASTYLPSGSGRVFRARVRSGASPAPLRISVISSSGGVCCTTRIIGPTFQPTPNAVTTVPLDLPAGSGLDPASGQDYVDIVAVDAVGPGTLPVSDQGRHGDFADMSPGRSFASFLHPELAAGESNADRGGMDGYEVLLQADWCGTPQRPGTPVLALPAVGAAAPGCPGGGTSGTTGTPADPATPGTPTPPAAPGVPVPAAAVPTLATRSGDARLRGRTARVRLACGAAAPCRGSLRLLRRSGEGGALGRGRVALAAGARGTVAVTLTPAGRSAARRSRRLLALAVVDLGAGSPVRLPLVVRR